VHNVRETVDRIRGFREGILRRHRDTPLFQKSLADVRRVAIINSSSRSGSSLLYALLCKLPGVIALTGEAAPFYKLNTCLESFNLFESDKIPKDLIDRVIDYNGLSRDFFSDLHCAESAIQTATIDRDDYADHLMLRFSLQWTDIEFDRSILSGCIERAFDRYAARHPLFATDEFYLELLDEVTTPYPEINPFYYDLSTDRVALRFPFLDVPEGPPNRHVVIEEPPFVLQHPRTKATPADLAEKTLLLKSTVDCYRMNLIEKVFPGAEIRIIHLVRNPAATTNGIYDGWLHRGFFSHNLQPYFEGHDDLKELRIKGYSDRHPFGRTWWNFDLPEGWQEYADRDLVEVCAFQWRSANAEILEYLAASGRPSCRVRFDEIIRSPQTRQEAFERLLAFIGAPADQLAALELDDLPVVQATLPPQLYRWKRRRELIARLLDDPRVVAMAERLGYPVAGMEEWL
jgi:hypothetical protein